MPYQVQFVGLVCFYKEEGARWALLPDGREPGPGIDPHYPTLIVAPDAVVEANGWSDAELAEGILNLPRSLIVLEGADVHGRLDTDNQDKRLPRLRTIDPNFEIDLARADTVARLLIRRGELSANQVPGGTAVISQLEVPHDGEITIVVKPVDGTARTLRLKPGTEVILGNMADRGIYGQAGRAVDRHFEIYGKLSVKPVTLQEPKVRAAVSAPVSQSHHWYFLQRRPINLETNCSNTGYP